jgi:hypothetical protein
VLDAQGALSKAKMVVFLGFGYDDDNLTLLRLTARDSCLTRGCPMYGTAYRLEDPERLHLVNRLANGAHNNSFVTGTADDDCLLFLRKHAQTLTLPAPAGA